MTDIAKIAAGLSEAQRRAFRGAETADDGETYARSYSVPDRFTKAYRVYGLGDPLNRAGLAVRAHLMKDEGR